MPRYLPALRSLLPQPRRFRQRLESVLPPERRLGPVEWVLSRPLYRFSRFELKGIARPKRAGALALQVRQWSPYTSSGQYTAWIGDDALVWLWDADRVGTSMEEHGLQPRRVRIVPETLLHSPHADGAQLRECMDGVEGQIWYAGTLAASRWWSSTPGEADWARFQRDAGLAPDRQLVAVPAPRPIDWLERAWVSDQGLRESATSARREPLILAAAAGALGLATLWYATGLVKLQLAARERAQELAKLEGQAQPLMLARNGALDEIERVEALRSLNRYPDPLGLMAKVGERLAPTGAVLRDWDFQNGKLRITIASLGKAGTSEYVKSFHSPGLFENVQAAPGTAPDTLVVTMDVALYPQISFLEHKK